MKTFNTAIEARNVVDKLRYEARKLNYNKDIYKLITNAEKLVSELGDAEVRARQSHKPHPINKHKAELAKSIDYIEKLMLILRLSQ